MRLISYLADLLLKWQASSDHELFAKIELYKREVDALPLQNGKEIAELILSDKEKFRCVKSTPSAHEREWLKNLSPSLRGFFEKYQSVETVYGDTQINRAEIGQSEYNDAFVKIGCSTDFTDLVVKANEDSVYRIDGSEKAETDYERYPSIYHLIVMIDKLVYSPKQKIL